MLHFSASYFAFLHLFHSSLFALSFSPFQFEFALRIGGRLASRLPVQRVSSSSADTATPGEVVLCRALSRQIHHDILQVVAVNSSSSSSTTTTTSTFHSQSAQAPNNHDVIENEARSTRQFRSTHVINRKQFILYFNTLLFHSTHTTTAHLPSTNVDIADDISRSEDLYFSVEFSLDTLRQLFGLIQRQISTTNSSSTNSASTSFQTQHHHPHSRVRLIELDIQRHLEEDDVAYQQQLQTEAEEERE